MAQFCEPTTVPSQTLQDIEDKACQLDAKTAEQIESTANTNEELIAAYAALSFACPTNLLHTIEVGRGFPDFTFTLGDIVNTPGWIEAVGVNVEIDPPSLVLQRICDAVDAQQALIDDNESDAEELTTDIICNACE